MEEEFDSSVTDKTPLMMGGGQGRTKDFKPELCTATGEGLTRGKINEVARFKVHAPKEAGVANLGVAVVILGQHKPPDKLNIINNHDGTTDVIYQPKAPGQHKIDCNFGGIPIKGSPFFATVEGEIPSNPHLVTASGEALTKPIPCGQRSVITFTAKEGAGLGPLRGKWTGPVMAPEFEMHALSQETYQAIFHPKANGVYRLHFMWGNGDDDKCQIPGSPFTIKVGNALDAVPEYQAWQFQQQQQQPQEEFCVICCNIL